MYIFRKTFHFPYTNYYRQENITVIINEWLMDGWMYGLNKDFFSAWIFSNDNHSFVVVEIKSTHSLTHTHTHNNPMNFDWKKIQNKKKFGKKETFFSCKKKKRFQTLETQFFHSFSTVILFHFFFFNGFIQTLLATL